MYYLDYYPLRRYYSYYYPVILPQVLREAIAMNKTSFILEKRRSFGDNEKYFHQFHALNQTIDNEDVNQFLWFLDNGYTGRYSLRDLEKALGNTEECFKLRSKKSPLGQSIRGFFQYLDFLDEFYVFLSECGDIDYKSTYWMYHSYWFTKIAERLHAPLNSFFEGVQNQLTKEYSVELLQSGFQVDPFREKYERILNEIVYSPDYKKYFETSFTKWKGNNTIRARRERL